MVSRETSGYQRPSRGTSSTSVRKQRRAEPESFCSIDAGQADKLPRPCMGIDAEAVYGAIEEEGPVDFSPTSPSKTPTSPTSPERSVAREQNAARQFLWTSLDAVMLRPAETASNLPVPLAAVLTPFADTADFTSLPLSDIGSDEPLRCPRCRCYANPHFKWSARENRKFTCNMCSHSLDVPQKFLEDMERNGQCADADTHPELVYGSVDFTAGALIEPDLPGPFVPSVCFAIETSPDAISSGFTKAALEALEKALQAPHTLERDVYLVTFDEAVTFYVPISHGRFRAVVMPDMEEPFVPVSPESLGVHVADPDGKEMFLELLSTLQEEFTDEASPQCGYGGEESPDPFHLGECQDLTSSTVLRTGVQTLAALGGGDLVLFQVSVPSTWGPEEAPEDDDVLSPKGPSSSPKTPKTPKTPINITPLKKRKRSFLEEMHRSCCRTGVAVSAVTATSDGDVSRLHWLPWRTGGDVLHMPSFTPTATQSMSSHLQHWLQKMQASAYNCVVKLRCSKGLSCKALLAPWPAAASSEDQSAFEVPRLSPDMSVTFSLLPEVEPDSDEDYPRSRDRKTLAVQAAILYTNCKGERLLRTHTRSLTVISSARQIFGSINIAPLMAFLLKQAAMIALDPAQNAKLPRDMLLESCLQILASFRRRCLDYNSAKKAMVTSRQLLLLPLYVLSARKLLYSLVGSKDGKAQTEALQRILRMPVHNIMLALYPRVYPLPGNTPEGVDLPRHCPAAEEQVSRGPAPAYLVTNGFGMWYHQSGDRPELREAAGELAERIREVLQPVSDWIPLFDLPRLSVPLKTEEKIMQEATPSGRPRYGSRTPHIAAVAKSSSEHISWPEKVLLSSLFVEGTGVTEMSYSDWVLFLQEQLALRLSES
ncbi:Protein transport protein Sec24C (SEC24-related protein C) [Durusdinium trenchii]|uniref:Protein transport protein Sec24C (SEC24-related protein C) n=1 Tax=Durusdinium trenchii TaxID=1381693 RepID=A0ABP0KPA6_9DINO